MTSVPSVTPSTESSGPSSRSSSTIVAPLFPNRCSTSIASIALSASSTFEQTITPLPRASPSALTAIRPSLSRAHFLAWAGWVKTSCSAVGIPARFITPLAKALLDSMRPAPRSGPKTGKPAWRSASPAPASTAASGPSTTRPRRSRLADPTTRTFIDSARSAQNARSVGRLLPLDRARWLRRDVEDDPVDALDLVDYPVADPRQHLVRHAGPVGRHRVLARHDPHRDDVGVCPKIAHHADSFQRGQHRERLPHLPVQAVSLDLVDHDPIGVAKDLQALGCHLAEAADGQPGTWERLAIHHLLGHPELEPDRPYLVLEEVAQWLDELEAEPGRQTADIVVRLDLHRGGRDVGRGRLDHVRVKGALREEVDVAQARRLRFEDGDELSADDPALLLRVDHTFQGGEEAVGGVDVADVHVEVAVHHVEHPLRLFLAQQPVVDEDAGQLIPDRAVY